MGTVTKALTLLTYFNRSRNVIGLSEMSRLSGVNKATVHRMLGELQQQGFVEQVGSSREYRLGPALLRLASLREASVPTREIAMQILRNLSDLVHETTHFSLLHGDVLSTTAFAYSQAHGTRVTMEDASVLTLHSTSSGLAVLAYSDKTYVNHTLAKNLAQHTHKTITDPDVLKAMLAPIRAKGFSEIQGGFEADVHSFGAPIFDSSQRCIGAIAIAAPITRVSQELRETIARELPKAAAELTRLIGGFPPDDFPIGANT